MEEKPTEAPPVLARRRQAREERARSRHRLAAWGVGALVLATVFFVGVALGRALAEAPRPGGTRTDVRTLAPGTVPPVTRTVTVTSTGP